MGFYVRNCQRGGTTRNPPGVDNHLEYPRQEIYKPHTFHINNLDNQIKHITTNKLITTMKRKLTLEGFITIVFFIGFGFGLIIGLSNNQYQKKLKLYDRLQEITEQLLDECDAAHNICDTVCEGDTYAEYMELREKLGLE